MSPVRSRLTPLPRNSARTGAAVRRCRFDSVSPVRFRAWPVQSRPAVCRVVHCARRRGGRNGADAGGYADMVLASAKPNETSAPVFSLACVELLEQPQDEVGEVVVPAHGDDVLDGVLDAAQQRVDGEGEAADDEEEDSTVGLVRAAVVCTSGGKEMRIRSSFAGTLSPSSLVFPGPRSKLFWRSACWTRAARNSDSATCSSSGTIKQCTLLMRPSIAARATACAGFSFRARARIVRPSAISLALYTRARKPRTWKTSSRFRLGALGPVQTWTNSLVKRSQSRIWSSSKSMAVGRTSSSRPELEFNAAALAVKCAGLY